MQTRHPLEVLAAKYGGLKQIPMAALDGCNEALSAALEAVGARS